jgi:hypothetical protein
MMVPRKSILIAGGSAGAGLLLLLALTVAGTALNRVRNGAPKPWDGKAFKANYVESQLKTRDNAFATLTLSYEVENVTDVDYRLAGGPGLVIVRKLVSSGVLSQEEPIHLSYPVFLPARQSARIAIEITQPFRWPHEDDPAYDDKLRDFVKQRLANVGEFVVFDEAGRCRLELPSAWEELQETMQANN